MKYKRKEEKKTGYDVVFKRKYTAIDCPSAPHPAQSTTVNKNIMKDVEKEILQTRGEEERRTGAEAERRRGGEEISKAIN